MATTLDQAQQQHDQHQPTTQSPTRRRHRAPLWIAGITAAAVLVVLFAGTGSSSIDESHLTAEQNRFAAAASLDAGASVSGHEAADRNRATTLSDINARTSTIDDSYGTAEQNRMQALASVADNGVTAHEVAENNRFATLDALNDTDSGYEAADHNRATTLSDINGWSTMHPSYETAEQNRMRTASSTD